MDNESFEILANFFYYETGYMAPGKSVPMAMVNSESYEKRRKAWDEWMASDKPLKAALKEIAELKMSITELVDD